MLVRARLFDGAVGVAKRATKREGKGICGFLGESLPRSEASQGFIRSGELVGLSLFPSIEIVLDDPLPIRRVGKRQIQESRVAYGLLESVAGQPEFTFGFHHRDRESGRDLKKVIGTKWAIPLMASPGSDDAPVGYPVLLDDLLISPAGALEGRHDVIPASVKFERASRDHWRSRFPSIGRNMAWSSSRHHESDLIEPPVPDEAG